MGSCSCNNHVLAKGISTADLNCYIRIMLSNAASRGLPGVLERTGGGSADGRAALWMWGIFAVGAALRLLALGYKSFWIDEIASVAIARRAAPVFWHFLWHDEGNMALYYVLLRPWLHFGYAEGVVRLLSVIPGILSIPVMYLLGRHLFGRETGILAAALLALNPCAIAVSQEARAYSFLVLGVLLSTYLFVLLIEAPSYKLACGYAIIAGLTCYFHYFGVLVPVAHAISLAGAPRDRRPWKPLLLAGTIIVVMAAPILWLIHAQDIGHISWVQRPSLLELYHLGVFLAAYGGKAVGAVLLAVDLVLVGLFFVKLRTVWREVNDELPRWRYMLVASSVFSPIVITLLISIVRPAFYHRFLIICLPGWLMMTAVGVQQVRLVPWRRYAIAAICVLSLVGTFIVYRRVTEDWRGAIGYLIVNARPEDRVLYYQSVGEFAGESYRDWLPGGNKSRPTAIGVDPTRGEWRNEVDHAKRVFVVLYRAKANDAEVDRLRRELLERGLALRLVSIYPGVTVMEFAQRAVVSPVASQ
jgi:mannosyltransferase